MRRNILAAVALALAMLPAACGDDADEPSPSPTPAPESTTAEDGGTESPSPSISEPEPEPEPTSWPTDDVSAPFSGTVPPVPILLDLRVGSHPEDGYDRVAFEFDSLPGYEIGYRTDIVYDGSGDSVDLPGDAFIQLVFNPAQAHDDQGDPTLTDPPTDPVTVDAGTLEAYLLNGDFEGSVSVALGLDEKAGFHVDDFEAENGNYVVYIDIAR
jgi:hypothetical protein